MAAPNLSNTRFITTPDHPARVYKVRRYSDGTFRQLFSVTESNGDADRWGYTNDRIWITRAEASNEATRLSAKDPCEVVPFVLAPAPEARPWRKRLCAHCLDGDRVPPDETPQATCPRCGHTTIPF